MAGRGRLHGVSGGARRDGSGLTRLPGWMGTSCRFDHSGHCRDACGGQLRKMPVNESLASESSGRRLRSLRFAAERQESLDAGVAMIAGFLDAYGIIAYGTYLSFMSGNTTQAGYKIAQGNFGEPRMRRWRSCPS